ncbi:hypothetical protein GO998_08920 [Ralstonia syzygii]|uniref:Uncharacterized protein n=1 Tax=Ralstonia syzygii TaxID=28097 RepID=A0ABX7ZEK2_9RALS|nr:hypothetical protein [Ralstonia syzygii]QUP53865.1 hypothetical protein GO998_08920 [Ralstonia syzygii]
MFKNRINAARKLAAASVGVAAVAGASSANAASVFETITAGVDFSAVGTWVGVIGVAIVGICLGFKAIDLGKRGINKA